MITYIPVDGYLARNEEAEHHDSGSHSISAQAQWLSDRRPLHCNTGVACLYPRARWLERSVLPLRPPVWHHRPWILFLRFMDLDRQPRLGWPGPRKHSSHRRLESDKLQKCHVAWKKSSWFGDSCASDTLQIFVHVYGYLFMPPAFNSDNVVTISKMVPKGNLQGTGSRPKAPTSQRDSRSS